MLVQQLEADACEFVGEVGAEFLRRAGRFELVGAYQLQLVGVGEGEPAGEQLIGNDPQ